MLLRVRGCGVSVWKSCVRCLFCYSVYLNELVVMIVSQVGCSITNNNTKRNLKCALIDDMEMTIDWIAVIQHVHVQLRP